MVMCRSCFYEEGWAPCRYCDGATCGEHGIVCEPCDRRACDACYRTAKWEFCKDCEFSTCPDCIKDGICAECASTR